MKAPKGKFEGEDIIHTVVATTDRRGGMALGIDRAGKPFKLWLLSERALELAIDKVEAFSRALEMKLSVHPLSVQRGAALGARAVQEERELR